MGPSLLVVLLRILQIRAHGSLQCLPPPQQPAAAGIGRLGSRATGGFAACAAVCVCCGRCLAEGAGRRLCKPLLLAARGCSIILTFPTRGVAAAGGGRTGCHPPRARLPATFRPALRGLLPSAERGGCCLLPAVRLRLPQPHHAADVPRCTGCETVRQRRRPLPPCRHGGAAAAVARSWQCGGGSEPQGGCCGHPAVAQVLLRLQHTEGASRHPASCRRGARVRWRQLAAVHASSQHLSKRRAVRDACKGGHAVNAVPQRAACTCRLGRVRPLQFPFPERQHAQPRQPAGMCWRSPDRDHLWSTSMRSV